MSALPPKRVGRWQPNLTSSGRGRRPHSRRILDDRASLWLYHCPNVRAHTLSVLWGDLDLAKSAYHRMYRLPDTVGRRIRQLDDQTTPARASPDRRHKKPCLGIHGGGCHGFGAGAWAADLERQHLVPCARGRRDHAIGANPPTRQHTAPIRAGHISSSGDAATVCRTENCRSVSRRWGRCPPRQSVDIRTAPATRGFGA